MSNPLFAPVSRQKTKLRMALAGVSGGGKTLSALYIAYGLTGDWGKVALIDTEHERACEYASRTDLPTPTGAFLYAPMDAPYSAEKYKEYVMAGAEAVGPDGCVVIDSLSHAWKGTGGVLDYKDQVAAASRGGNGYTAWNEAGKMQNDLVDTILSAPCHTICTLRVKQDYAMQPNERGKMEPVKLGLAPVQRDDLEYEFDVVLTLGRDHMATASKDVTFLDGFHDVITPQLGADLAAWLNEGKEPMRLICADCGEKIRDSRQSNGELIPARVCAEKATAHFGRMLCKGCMLKAFAAQQAATTKDKREEAADDTGETAQGEKERTAGTAQP